MISNEEWCWEGSALQELNTHVVATKGQYVVTLVRNHQYEMNLWLRQKDFKYTYEWGNNTRYCRTVWELECQKSRLINEGFKINWENYQLILQMFVERFKTYSPYLLTKETS